MRAWVRQYRQDYLAHVQEWPQGLYTWQRNIVFVLPTVIGCIAYFIFSRLHPEIDLEQLYPRISTVFQWITHQVKNIFYVLYLVLLADALRKRDFPRQRLVWRVILFQLLISLIAVHILKRSLGFPRPGYTDITPFTGQSSHHSMPSGHTTDIFVSAFPLALYYWNRWRHGIAVLCCGAATLVAFSRIWIHSHHPQDVLAGVLLASLATYLLTTSRWPLATKKPSTARTH